MAQVDQELKSTRGGGKTDLIITGDGHRALRERILEYIRKGSHPGVAFEAAGLSYYTYRKYIRVAEGRDTQWRPSPEILHIIQEFVEQIRQAEAVAESDVVSFVKEEAMKDGQLALKYLSLRYPSRWARVTQNTQVNITWQMQAVKMVQSGEVTWEVLEDEFGKDIVDRELRPLLLEPASRGNIEEAKQDEVIEGVFSKPAEKESSHSEDV